MIPLLYVWLVILIWQWIDADPTFRKCVAMLGSHCTHFKTTLKIFGFLHRSLHSTVWYYHIEGMSMLLSRHALTTFWLVDRKHVDTCRNLWIEQILVPYWKYLNTCIKTWTGDTLIVYIGSMQILVSTHASNIFWYHIENLLILSNCTLNIFGHTLKACWYLHQSADWTYFDATLKAFDTCIHHQPSNTFSYHNENVPILVLNSTLNTCSYHSLKLVSEDCDTYPLVLSSS